MTDRFTIHTSSIHWLHRSLPALLILTGIIFSLVGLSSPAKAEPIAAVRMNLSGYEAEFFLSSIGLMYTYFPIAYSEEIGTPSGSTWKKCTWDRTFLTARHFFEGPGSDGWYLGGGIYTGKLVEEVGDCTTLSSFSFTEVSQLESGNVLMAGYMWNWDSGIQLDLGFRPGIVSVGFAF